jgi:hypothetical protein
VTNGHAAGLLISYFLPLPPLCSFGYTIPIHFLADVCWVEWYLMPGYGLCAGTLNYYCPISKLLCYPPQVFSRYCTWSWLATTVSRIKPLSSQVSNYPMLSTSPIAKPYKNSQADFNNLKPLYLGIVLASSKCARLTFYGSVKEICLTLSSEPFLSFLRILIPLLSPIFLRAKPRKLSCFGDPKWH